MSDWSNLEEFVKSLLQFDQPTRTPLSGGTKHEEDVVSTHLVSQCKYTSDKNISILSKDLERLLTASNLLHKFPLFFNQSEAGKTISIPFTTNTTYIISEAIKLITVLFSTSELPSLINISNNLSNINLAEVELNKIKSLFYTITKNIKDRISMIENTLDSKRDNLMMYNLFDNKGNKDGT